MRLLKNCEFLNKIQKNSTTWTICKTHTFCYNLFERWTMQVQSHEKKPFPHSFTLNQWIFSLWILTQYISMSYLYDFKFG